MIEKNRICICCGKEYSYCPTCARDRGKPSYMTAYCSENCMTIFDAATRYGFGLKTKEEAKAIIEACDLTDLETFNSTVKSDVKKIISVEASKDFKKAVKNEQTK